MASGLELWGRGAGAVLIGGVVLATAACSQARAPEPAAQRLAAPAAAQAILPSRPPEQPAPIPAAIPAAAPSDQALVIKRILTLDGPFRHGDYYWDDEGVPPGPIVITVDLAAQTLSVFRGGYEIGTAVIMYGADNKPSPLGIFPITQKDADHVSNLYDVPMPYMLRLTNDGVAIHGSNVERDAATNGCIGVPTKFAKLLFAQAKLGDRVIITNGETLQLGQAITAS